MKVGPTDPGALLQALKDGRIEDRDLRLKTATTLLEGAFYQELFKVMRETVPDGGLSGPGEDVFTSMLDQHMSEAAAAQNDSGLGAALYRHFTRLDP